MIVSLARVRMLAELAEQGTIAATAESLGYSGPAVSQQLALLEREAGVPLLERGPRRIHLTEAGRRLAGRARELLGSLAAAEREMRRLAGLEEGLVSLAAFPSAAAALRPDLFSGVTREMPGLSLRLGGPPA